MKKTSILIAMFAVIAVASAARAELNINFDGNLKPQTLNDIFAQSHQIIPSGVLDQTPVPVPANPVETPLPMIEPWQITPNYTCMMVPWTDENGVLHDCENPDGNHCTQIEIAPGVTFPLCLTDDAIIAYKSNPRLIGTLAGGLRQTYAEYSTGRTRLPAALKKLSADKGAKILYNGKRLFLVKRPAGRWHSDESLAAHSDYNENHPENQGHIEVAYPGNTLVGAVGGATNGNLGSILIGAVIGFWQDANDYANNN